MKYKYKVRLSGVAGGSKHDICSECVVDLNDVAFTWCGGTIKYGEFFGRLQTALEYYAENPISVTGDVFVQHLLGEFFWFDEDEKERELDFKTGLFEAMKKTILLSLNQNVQKLPNLFLIHMTRSLVVEPTMLFRVGYNLEKFRDTIEDIAIKLKLYWFTLSSKQLCSDEILREEMFNTSLKDLEKIHEHILSLKDKDLCRTEFLEGGDHALPELTGLLNRLKVRGS